MANNPEAEEFIHTISVKLGEAYKTVAQLRARIVELEDPAYVKNMQNEITNLKEQVATCRELRALDQTALNEIRKLRQEMHANGLLR